MPRMLPAFAAALLAALSFTAAAAAQSRTSVEQIGEMTSAQINHLSTGPGNSSAIRQDGRDLTATVSVTGAGNASAGPNTVSQSGEGSAAEVTVVGDLNTFSIDQRGGLGGYANNDASITIVGSENDASITQINALGPNYFNVASIEQTGVLNYASIEQTIADQYGLGGGGNTAYIRQDGVGNDGRIGQTGTDNSASIRQNGNDNLAEIIQTGEGHNASIEQNGDGMIDTITQTGCGISGGCPGIVVTRTSGW